MVAFSHQEDFLPNIYTIALLFDAVAEETLRHAWAEVALKAGLPDKMTAMTGSRPHISLGGFDKGHLDQVVSRLAGLAARQAPFDVRFESLGIFSARGILFFGPAVNRSLLDIHEKCHAGLATLVQGWAPYYLPERLVFHSSINLGLNRDELLRAVSAAMDFPLPFGARAESLGLLKLPTGDFNKAFTLSG